MPMQVSVSQEFTRGRWTYALPIIVAVAFAAVAPMLVLGTADGHDIEYHVLAWAEAAHQWHAGVWFSRWADLAHYGFGEPGFVFYPPLSRILGAFAVFWLPTNAAAGGYYFLVLVIAGISMFALVRHWFAPGPAILAAAFYAVNPYILLCVYQRSSCGELLASAFLPLLLLAAMRLPAGNGAMVSLAIAFAIFWISDLPAAVVVTYGLALAVGVLALLNRSLSVLWRGALGMVLGFALVAFFVLPAAYEQRWVNIAAAISPEFRPENWEYTWAFDEEALWFYAIISGLVYGESIAAALAGGLSWKWRTRHQEAWWVLMALAAMSVFMLLPVSHFVWTHLPKLEFVQFPWRWLLVLTACLTVLLIAALARLHVYWTGLLLTAIALCGGIASGGTALWHRGAIADYERGVRDGHGYESGSQFIPASVDIASLYNSRGMPQAAATDRDASVQVARWRPEHKTIVVESSRPVGLVLRLLDYPAWRATVNGRAVVTSSDKAGRLTLPVPAGNSRIEVTFVRTRDRTAGIVISVIALLILTAVTVACRKPSCRQKEANA